jgi:hypothetical protein
VIKEKKNKPRRNEEHGGFTEKLEENKSLTPPTLRQGISRQAAKEGKQETIQPINTGQAVGTA